MNQHLPDEILPNLWLGSRHARLENETFMAHVTHLVDASCMSDLPPVMANDNVQVLYVRLDDSPDSLLPFEEVSRFIETALQTSFDDENKASENKNVKSTVFVHCNQGMSRSAALVMGYLILSHNYTLKRAFFLVKEKRRLVLPNIGFMRQLIDLEKRALNGETTCELGGFGTIQWKK